MKYAKLNQENVIEQIQPNSGSGFVEVPDDAVCGMTYSGGVLTTPDPEVIEPTYREKRAAAYIEQSSPEGNFMTSTGDWLDALADFAETGAISAKLQDLLDKRAAIKQQFPQV